MNNIMPERRIRADWLAAVCVLLLSLGITITGWLVSTRTIEAEAEAKFKSIVTEVTEAIVTRMAVYEQVLRGGVGLFLASEDVSRNEWRVYVEGLALEERFPGVQGIGFSLRIPPGQVDEHIASVRAEGFPQYTIRPDDKRDEVHSIIYLEPFSSRNLRAFGYDMYSNPIRRAAMERARDTGRPALSGRVTLVQEAETQVQAGFLMYLPVYTNGQPRNSVTERQRTLEGFVYSPFRMNDLMENILGSKDELLHLHIFDGSEPDPQNLLFDSATEPTSQPHVPRQTDSRGVLIDGRQWRLDFATRPAFENSVDRHLPTAFLVAGMAISGLLFAVILSLGSTRRRAQGLASDMTTALQASEERTRRIVDTAYDGIITIDPTGLIQSINPAVERIFGWTATDVVGKNVKMLMPEPYHGGHDQYLTNYLGTGERKIIGIGREVEGLRRDGSTFSLELAVNEVKTAGQHLFVGVLRDVSDRKNAEKEMLKVNEQLTLSVAALEKRDRELTLLNRMNDLLMTCRDQEEAFHIIRASLEDLFRGPSGALAVLDKNEGELITKVNWGEDLITPDAFSLDDCWAVRQGRAHDVTGSKSRLSCTHVKNAPPSGYFCLPLVVQNSMLGVLTVAVHESDPSARDAAKQLIVTAGETIKLSLSNIGLRDAMREQAIRDPLTKLYNRRFMEESLTRELSRAQRQDAPLTIAVADLDFFKRVNDTYGHDAGDHVLREVAQLLLRNLRTTDIACRFGGEEFVIILPGTTLKNARRHMETMREKLESLSIHHGSNDLSPITMSIGLAAFSGRNDSGDLLISAADAALYLAKQSGRNRVSVEILPEPENSLGDETSKPPSPGLATPSA